MIKRNLLTIIFSNLKIENVKKPNIFDTSLQALRAGILEFEMSVHRNRITGKVFRRRRQTDADGNRTDGSAKIVV